MAARGLASRILSIVGAIVLVGGVLATYLRSEVVEQRSFVAHATDALRTSEVRELVSAQVVEQLVDEGGTDLIAARPLVRPLVDALVGTDAFAELFEVAAQDTHRLLFTREDDVSFAVADAGTLAIEAVRTAAPSIADSLPSNVDVDVVALRDSSLLAGTVRTAERARTLAFVLPPAGLLLLLAGLGVARDRRAALVRGGLAVATVAGLVAAGLAVWRAQIGSGAVTPGELQGADVRAAVDAAWGEFFGALRGWVVATGLAGLLVAALAAGRVTAATATARLRALLDHVGPRSVGGAGRIVRGAALIGAGGLLLWQPEGVVTGLALVLGGTLVYIGIGELATLLPEGLTRDVPMPARRPRGRRASWLVPAATVLIATGIAGAIAGRDEEPPPRPSLAPKVPGRATATGCNGSLTLCDRRLDEVAFAGTHNSFSAAFEPGWLFANQRFGIARQLDAGIRLLLLDPHHGVRHGDRVRTDLQADGTDRNRAARQLSPVALRAAERLAGRVGLGGLKGRRGVYLCHTLCELGAEPFVDELIAVKDFLARRPSEVVMLVLEPFVSPGLVASSLRRAGLLDALAVLDRDKPMPTLGQLVRRGDRLIVLTERDGGAYDWYHPLFEFTQDTPLGARKRSEFSCAPNRGDSDSPLLMLNHWIDRFPPPLGENRRASTRTALRRRVDRCEEVRGRPVNLIAVDFYDEGAVVAIARELNARR